MDELIKIQVTCSGQSAASIWSYPGQNLWEALAANGLTSAGACGGHRTCGKCKLKVKGPLKPPDEAERYLLLPEEVKAGMRLACHISVVQGLEVFIEDKPVAVPPLPAVPPGTAAEPMVAHKKIYLPGFDRHNPVSIQQRLQQAVPALESQLSVPELNELYSLDRADRPVLELNALLADGRRLIYAGKTRQRLYGVAVDVGTTSLVGSLLDLETNQTLSTATMPNMQKVYGDDIISRLQYCLSHEDGLQTLHQVIINNTNALIADLTSQCGGRAEQVFKLVMVGNPVMTHLFLGLNPAGLAQAPFCGAIGAALRCRPGQLGLLAHREAELMIPPQAGNFIGSDALAGLLTLNKPLRMPYLYLDIGTNSEVILAADGGMWAASAAAGPAFEGAGIRCGMKAAPGVIDHFYWHEGPLSRHVLGQEEARGMCGSALIDLLAWLLDKGLMAANGNLLEKKTELQSRNGEQGKELIIVPAAETRHGIPVVLSQEDLRRLQLAKAAVRAASEILLARSGLRSAALQAVYLAGAFGSYLNAENAIRIGLLPEVSPDIVHNIGNAAGRGAACYLISPRGRQQAEQLQQTIKTIVLADQGEFQQLFLRYMDF